ncbi:MAG TPA: hypothetical protein ENJ00_08660 [Phycisphaerales bacterium]|nr:hypothetical protein [Phycisphaerales bacterium]
MSISGVELVWVIVGGVAFVAGLILLAASKRMVGGPGVRVPVVGVVGDVTVLTLALVLVILGYHTVAYGGPADWVGFRVRPDLGWLVYVGGVAALGGALIAERLERREDGN